MAERSADAFAARMREAAFRWPGGGFGLRVADFALAQGERLFLHGPSGSGKSTLLALLTGVVAPQAGRVEALGRDLGALSAAARDRLRGERMGVIFQTFNLLPYATAVENVRLGLAFAPERRARAAAQGGEAAAARALLARLGLPEGAVDRVPAARLSVGQQQRVAVARAMIGGPSLVVADEPTSALDADAQDAFLSLLFDQVAATGAALLMVSHDRRLADRFDRAADLREIAAPC
jgi:putative ABC transport system ATP-binding protein